jgi:hypothetical protein
MTAIAVWNLSSRRPFAKWCFGKKMQIVETVLIFFVFFQEVNQHSRRHRNALRLQWDSCTPL